MGLILAAYAIAIIAAVIGIAAARRTGRELARLTYRQDYDR